MHSHVCVYYGRKNTCASPKVKLNQTSLIPHITYLLLQQSHDSGCQNTRFATCLSSNA